MNASSLSRLILVVVLYLPLLGCWGIGDPDSEPETPIPPDEGGCLRTIDCAAGQFCEQTAPGEPGICVPRVCDDDDDCNGGEVCERERRVCLAPSICSPSDNQSCAAGSRCVVEGNAEVCRPLEDMRVATSCNLARQRLVLADGASTDLHVLGMNDGAPVPYSEFFFSADVGSVVNGTLTAECDSAEPCLGALTIFNREQDACGSVEVVVHPPVGETAFRVVIVDAQTATGVAATIAVRTTTSDDVLLATTNTFGVAIFPNLATENILAVSAFSETHRWKTVMAPGTNDILLDAERNRDAEQGAGIKGQIDFDAIESLVDGDIRVGLAGTPLSPSGLNFELTDLTGVGRPTEFDLDGLLQPQSWSVPQSMVVMVGTEAVRDTFISRGDEGPSLLWSIGGEFQLSESADFLTPPDNGSFTKGAHFKRALRRFGRFNQGVRYDLQLEARVLPDTSPASTDDVTWPFEESTGTPTTQPSMKSVFEVPPLPCTTSTTGGSCDRATDAVTVSSVFLPSRGLVPLGMLAEEDGDADGLISAALPDYEAGDSPLFFAPPHDGLEGHLVVDMAFATNLDQFTDNSTDAAGVVRVASAHTSRVDFQSGFTDAPRGVIRRADEVVSLFGSLGADFLRVQLRDETGAWDIFVDAPTEDATIDIAALRPASVSGRTEEASLKAFALGNGYAGRSVDSLSELVALDGAGFSQSLLWIGAWTSTTCLPNPSDASCVLEP